MGINTEIYDDLVLRAIQIERLKQGEVRRVLRFLNKELYPDVTDRLAKAMAQVGDLPNKSARKIKRLTALSESIERLINNAESALSKSTLSTLNDLTVMEQKFVKDVIANRSPIVLSIKDPPPELLKSLVTETQYQGRLYKEWWSSWSRSAFDKTQAQIRIGIANGESVGAITRRLKGSPGLRATNGTYRQATRQAQAVVRTSINHVSSATRSAVYSENDDIIKGERWVATLDDRTSIICASLDGQVFPLGEGIRPPAHINCRSTMTPVLKSWKELGLDLKETPASTRASLDGQVPATETYGKWLKRQPISTQEKVLGKGKAELFRDGNLSIEKFTDTTYQPLTLRELRNT